MLCYIDTAMRPELFDRSTDLQELKWVWNVIQCVIGRHPPPTQKCPNDGSTHNQKNGKFLDPDLPSAAWPIVPRNDALSLLTTSVSNQ